MHEFDKAAHEEHLRHLSPEERPEATDRLVRYTDIEVNLSADERSQVFTTVYKVVHGEAYHVRSDGSLGQSWTELFNPTQVHPGYQPMSSGFVAQSLSAMSQAINNNSVCRAIWFSPAQHPSGMILCAEQDGSVSDRSYGSELIAFRNARGELMISVTQFEAPSDPAALRQEIITRTGVDLYDAKNGNADGATGFKVHIVEGTRVQGDTVQTSYWKGAISVDNPGRPTYAGEGRYLDPFADRVASRELAAQLQPGSHQSMELARAHVPEGTQNTASYNSFGSIYTHATNVQNNQSFPHQSSLSEPTRYHERSPSLTPGNVSAFPVNLEKMRDTERLPTQGAQQSNHVVFTPARLGEEIAHPHQARSGVFMDNSARIGFSSHLGDSIVVRVPVSQVLASELLASERSAKSAAPERSFSEALTRNSLGSKEPSISHSGTRNREAPVSPALLNTNVHHGERTRRGFPIVPTVPPSDTPSRSEIPAPRSTNHSVVSRNDRNLISRNAGSSEPALTHATQKQPSAATRGAYSKRQQEAEGKPSRQIKATSRRSALTSLKAEISASKRLYRRPHTSTHGNSRRSSRGSSLAVASSRAVKSRSLHRVMAGRVTSHRSSRLHRLVESLRRLDQRVLRKRGTNTKDPVQKLQAAKNRQKTSVRNERSTARVTQHHLTKLLHSIRHMTLRKALQSLVRAGLASQGRKDDVRLLKVLAMKLLRNLIQNLPGNAQLRRSILNSCSINELMFLRLTLMKRSRSRRGTRSNYFELDAEGQSLLLEFEELLDSLVHADEAGIESSDPALPDQEADEAPVFGYMADTTGPETFLKTVRMKQT